MSLRHQILLDSPSGYWPLDETSGTTAFDRSGNGRNGTYTGTVTLNSRNVLPDQKAPDFAGGYVSLGDLAAWSSSHAGASGTLTLEIWMVADSWSGSPSMLTKRAANNYEWTLYGNLAGIMEPAGGGPIVGGVYSGGLVADRLYHLAWTYDRATPLTVLYLDGVELGRSISFSGTSSDTTAVARIGGAGVDTGPFDGGLAHAAIFSTALSAARIKAHYEAGIRSGVMV